MRRWTGAERYRTGVVHRTRLVVALVVGVLILAAVAHAERASLPMWRLSQSPFQLEVTVLSLEEKPLDGRTTNIWHRVRIERVFVGEGLAEGDETAVVSQVVRNPPGTTGSSGDRGPFAGPNGLPRAGDRARLFAGGTASILATTSPNGWQRAERSIAFVAAEDEYRSEITMPFLARLVENAGIGTTSAHHATGDDGRGSSGTVPDPALRTGLTDDGRLAFADAAVLFMRFREFGHNTMIGFEAATRRGLPLVGFRTSTHAFRYPDGPGAARWNEEFPREVFGTGWTFHHGHASRTRVRPPDADAAPHPVLAGVRIPDEGLILRSWLYHVEPLPADCRVLLWGDAIESERPDAPQRQPVLWVRELARAEGLPRQRIAFTTLGHPDDFADPEMRVIAVQMIAWALGEEARIDDADRARIRSAVLEVPPLPPATSRRE